MDMSEKIRLDLLLFQRGLVTSREKGKNLIKNGNVFVDGKCADKAGAMLNGNENIEIQGETPRYVGRGGYKLEKVLESNSIRLNGKVCMDIGASTGGFTDCMLQYGADKVYAVDVGTNQLDEKLRQESKVISMENTNMRYLKPEDIGEAVDFAAMDVSFISVTKLLEPIRAVLKENACIASLIKPQFEAGRENIGKGGIVKDRKVHLQVLKNILRAFEENGFLPLWMSYSPIKGTDGNIEYLLLAQKREESREDCMEKVFFDESFLEKLVKESHELKD